MMLSILVLLHQKLQCSCDIIRIGKAFDRAALLANKMVTNMEANGPRALEGARMSGGRSF